MKNIHKAYTRKIIDVEFYFVKKYTHFHEIEGQPVVLDSLGMHTNFYTACKLANIHDKEVIEELGRQVYLPQKEAREFILQRVSNSIIRNAQHFLAKVRLAGMN